jgi:hypothetical protein
MREMVRQASPLARVLLILATLFLVVMCVSLAKRAWRGDSDFGVFYRGAVSLSNGAGGEIYAQRDKLTGWHNCIPPVGMVVFMGLAVFPKVVAGIVWGLLNVGMLGACIYFLRKTYAKLASERIHYEATLPFAVAMLAVFGGVCIQTGQTSVLFVACWIGYVWATSEQKSSWAGFLLAVPAVLKLYPLLMGLIPLLRRKFSEAVWGVAWILVLSIVVPLVVFQDNFGGLTSGFFQYQVLDPGGRVMTSVDPTAVSNQGLDAVLLRYLSYVPSFHDAAGNFPHLAVSPEAVLGFANLLRVVVIAITLWISIRWVRGETNEPPLLLVALWCAALYMILPSAKGRYAIYALPPLLVMMASAHRALAEGRHAAGKRLAFLTVVSCILLLQIVPDYTLQFGIGYIAPVILWIFVIRLSMSCFRLPRRPGEDYTTGGERATNVL